MYVSINEIIPMIKYVNETRVNVNAIEHNLINEKSK